MNHKRLATALVPFVGASTQAGYVPGACWFDGWSKVFRNPTKFRSPLKSLETLMHLCWQRFPLCHWPLEVWLRKKYQPLSVPFTWQRSAWLSMPSRRRSLRSLNFRMGRVTTSPKKVNSDFNSPTFINSLVSILWRILYLTFSWFLPSFLSNSVGPLPPAKRSLRCRQSGMNCGGQRTKR